MVELVNLCDFTEVAGDYLAACYCIKVVRPLIDGDTIMRNDAAWSETASAFLAAKREAEAATARLDAVKDRLVLLFRHPREQGAGVSVTRYWRAGNVDYTRVPEIQGVDLDMYRGKGREEVRVNASK